MGAEGFILKINKELVTNLQNADKAIESLDKHTTEAYEHMKSAFDKINGLNLDKFIATINSAKEKLSGLGDVNIKINATGLDSISNMSKEAMDSVIQLTNSMKQVSTSRTNGKNPFMSALIDTKGIEDNIKRLNAEFDSLSERMDKLFKAKKAIEELNRIMSYIDKLKAKLADVGNASGMDMKQSVQPYIEALHQMEKQVNALKRKGGTGDLDEVVSLYSKLEQQINEIISKDARLSSQLSQKQDVNKAVLENIKKYEELKNQLQDIEAEFARMKAQGLAYTPKGTLTPDAQALSDIRKELQEQIKMLSMSSEQAQKYSDKIISDEAKAADARIKEQERAAREAEKIRQEQIAKEQKDIANKMSEYDKLLAKIKEYEAQRASALDVKSRTTDASVQADTDRSIQEAERLIRESNARKIELENELTTRLADIQQKYRAQYISEEQKALDKKDASDKKDAENAQKNIDAQIKEYDKLLAKIEEVTRQKNFAERVFYSTKNIDTQDKAFESFDASDTMLQEYQKRRIELETSLGNKLDSIKQKYRAKELEEEQKMLAIREKNAERVKALNERETQSKIAEYDKLLKKIKEYEAQKLQAEKIKSTATDANIQAKAYTSIKDSERLIQESNTRKLELEKELGNQLIAVQQKYLSQELTEYQKNTNAKIAEYDKLLAKIREIEQQKSFASELSATTQDSETKTKADTSVKESEKQLQELNKRKLELENELQDKLANVRQKYRNRELQEAIRAAEIEQEKKRRTYDGAMDYSKNAKSILEERQAIKYLEAAREKLDKTDANYSRQLSELNNRILEHRRNINSAIEGSKELQKSHRNLMDISGQLARKLALVFSVSQIQGYIQKLVEVRGEFELNQRALQAMLQNKQMADEIWNKTVELAVQSPFRVKELVSYTKQLAAYRIEAYKLYETNKMLADISAGLGVDMQRLILAFGQVRSAAYLRGTEVRQFTEAGIPILEQLSKYLTELEGEAVTVGEVFERISKRMITFADVEEIFKRMTSEGGTFYRMQEIQAETLKGQISNLKDSFDVMFNAIGKANEGTIKNFINSIRFLTEHWEMFVPVLKAAVAMIAAMGVKALVTNKRLIALAFSLDVITNSATKQLKVMQVLATSWKALTSSIGSSIKGLASFAKANPWLVAITAVLGVLIKIRSVLKEHKDAINDITKEYDDMRKSVSGISVNFGLALNKGSFEEQKKQLSQLVSVAERDYNIQINLDWEQITPQNITDKFEEIRNQILDINTFSENFAINMQKASEWKPTGDIFSDLNKVGVVASENFRNLKNDAISVADALQDAKKNGQELTDAQEKAFEKLSTPQKINESELDYVERLKEGYDLLLGKYKKLRAEFDTFRGTEYGKPIKKQLTEEEDSLKRIGINAKDVNMRFADWGFSIKDAKNEFDAFIKTINLDENLSEEQRTAMVKFAIDKVALQNNWNDFTKNYLYKWVEEPLKVKINFVEDPDAPKELEGWQKTYKDLFGSLSTFYKGLSQETKQTEIIDNLKNKYKETKDLLERVKAAGEGAYPKESVTELTAKMVELNKQAKWFGVNLEESGKESASEINSRISLLKEMNKRYNDLAKTYDAVTAKEKVMTSFAKSFEEIFKGTGISIEDIDVTSMESMVNSLKKLEPIATKEGKKAYNALMKEIGEFEVQIGLNAKKDADKKLKDEVDKLFDQYDLSIELKKLDITDELAESFIGADALNLDELRKKIEELKPQFIGTDMEEEYKKYLDKIDDLENKAAKERMKTYSKYLMEEMSDRVKLRIETLKKIKEIEESKEFKPEQKERIIGAIKEESKKEEQKMDWEDFKGSDMYTMMFEDIEFLGAKSIEVLKNKLTELKSSLSDLPATDVKEIINQIEKLEDVAIERNPFKNLASDMQEIMKLRSEGKTEDVLQTQFVTSESNIENYQEELDAVNSILSAKERGLVVDGQIADASDEIVSWNEKYNMYLTLGTNELTSRVSTLNEQITKEKKASNEAKKGLNTYKSARKALKATANEWGNIKSSASQAYDGIKTIVEVMGGDADSIAMTLADSTMSLLDLVAQAVMFGLQLKAATIQAQAMGVAMNAAMGPIGWIVLAIQAIATIMKAIFSAKDKALEKQIDEQKRKIENLQKAYDKLKEKVDDAYSIKDLQKYNEEMKKNLELQIEAQKIAIAAQEQRKGAQREGSKAWEELQDMQEELDGMMEKQVERWEDVFSKVTDGILDDVLSAARDFTDAWWDAFQETGDGLSGLEENFNEMISNMIKQQAAMTITSAFVEKWKKDLGKYLNEDDLELTADEAKSWMDEVRATLPQLSEALENSWGEMANSLKETNDGGELSELSKGISSASEESIEILTAYANSIRFINQDSNEKLGMLLENFANGNQISNDMLAELRTQTRWMRDIYNLINGLTTSYSGGGSGIKVVM